MGIDFPNPVGLAAGLDKHAEHVDALARLGFGFLELGGVTPRPQPGNPRPRLFRLPEARAIINRYGLNSVGVDAFVGNLKQARRKAVIGVNIGKNRDTPNERAVEDYERCLEAVYPHVHYVSVNVSSPNTQGLRDLQSPEPSGSEPPSPTGRRARGRVVATRVSLVAELLLIAFGAAEIWRASAAGQTVSRPGQIAFWAGIVGLLASLLAPAIRARIARGRIVRPRSAP